MAKRKDFNKFRFDGLDYQVHTVKYVTMDRVNADETKLIIRVVPEQIFKTQYGYGVHLNANFVLFLKEWQVDINMYGCEIMLTKEYFKPKEFGFSKRFSDSKWDSLLKWETWVKIAKLQDSKIDENGLKLQPVRWFVSKERL